MLIFITALALLGLYRINIFAGIIDNSYFYVPAEAVFAIAISALLLYALMVLIEKFNKE